MYCPRVLLYRLSISLAGGPVARGIFLSEYIDIGNMPTPLLRFFLVVFRFMQNLSQITPLNLRKYIFSCCVLLRQSIGIPLQVVSAVPGAFLPQI